MHIVSFILLDTPMRLLFVSSVIVFDKGCTVFAANPTIMTVRSTLLHEFVPSLVRLNGFQLEITK